MLAGFVAPTHLLLLLLAAVILRPFWKIFSRAGFPGVLALLLIVPLLNVIVLYVVAFGKWRVAQEDASSPSKTAVPAS